MKYRNIIFLFVTLLLTVIVFVMTSHIEGFQEGASKKIKEVKKAIVDASKKAMPTKENMTNTTNKKRL